MSRRASLPGAAELFRVTGDPVQGASREGRPEAADDQAGPARPTSLDGRRGRVAGLRPAAAAGEAQAAEPDAGGPSASGSGGVAGGSPAGAGAPAGSAESDPGVEAGAGGRRPSGRTRHEEKITVYVSADELLDLEDARLLLRRAHGVRADRGRIVREAVALALADLESAGERSALVQRLRDR